MRRVRVKQLCCRKHKKKGINFLDQFYSKNWKVKQMTLDPFVQDFGLNVRHPCSKERALPIRLQPFLSNMHKAVRLWFIIVERCYVSTR